MEQMMEEDEGHASAHEQDIVKNNVQKQAPLHEDQGSASNVQNSQSQELKEQNVSDSVDGNKSDENKDVLKGGEDVKADISSTKKEDIAKLEADEGASQEGDTSGNVWKNVTITAGKLINKARLRVKGSWHFMKSKCKIDEKARTCKIYGQVKDTLQKLEKHMRMKHKKFKYKCRLCSKLYLSKNGLYKHKLYHKIGFGFTCKKCQKAFMFYSQYREHCNVHMDTNRLPCRKPGCDKDYGSTRARNYHKRSHKEKLLKCTFREEPNGPKCGMECNSKQSMAIHVRGTHGDGWTSLCGKHHDWQVGKTKHEKKCTTCKAIKEKTAKKIYKQHRND